MEARYYTKHGEQVVCLLCPHACHLGDDETGKCKVRQNRNGQLISLSYGNVSTLHIDPVEKKPLYHFLPGSSSLSLSTNGCVLSCINCQNWEISQSAVDTASSRQMNPAEIVELAVANNCSSISYTYTDPVAYYELMVDTAHIARERGIRNILVSSGYINVKPLEELIPLLDAANVDLKCFDDVIYQKLTGARLKPVLKTLELLNASEVWLEITNLVIPGWTDDMQMIKRMCQWLCNNGFVQVPLHLNRFIPCYKLQESRATPVESLLEARHVAMMAGLKYIYIGNVHGGTFKNTYCLVCGMELVTRGKDVLQSGVLMNSRCVRCKNVIEGIWQ